MSRCIDADALEKCLSDAEIEATKQRKYVFASALNTICGNIRNFPTIEPERKTGRWIQDGYGNIMCSKCKSYTPRIETGCITNRHMEQVKSGYCWKCGAKMEEDDGK